jgi:uncharacterized protein (TIGR03382 family)
MAASASAAPSRAISRDGQAPVYGFVAAEASPGGLTTARQVLPAGPTTAAFAQSRIIYLNRTGVTLRPGANDSRVNHSSIVTTPVTIAPWDVSDAQWALTVGCFKQIWAPFQVTVVETDPGNIPHIEAVFARSPEDLGLSDKIAGVSPFTANCSTIEDSVVFAFTANMPATGRSACEVMAQEVAHSYGLDHELVPADPMTYLGYSGDRAFQNKDAACGEYSARPCGINGSICRATQNSVAVLTAVVGATDPTVPVVDITAPSDGAVVTAGFAVTADASDDKAVTAVTLKIDGATVAKLTRAPYAFTAPSELPDGAHTIVVEVSDGTHHVNQTITVTQSADGTGAGTTAGGVPDAVGGGCDAGGDDGPIAFGVVILIVGFLFRRRR